MSALDSSLDATLDRTSVAGRVSLSLPPDARWTGRFAGHYITAIGRSASGGSGGSGDGDGDALEQRAAAESFTQPFGATLAR